MITVTEVQRHMGRSDPTVTFSSEDEAVVQQLIDSVIKAVGNYCDRDFESGTHTESVTSHGAQNLSLKGYPVNSVTSLTDKTSESVMSDTKYVVYAGGVVLKRGKFEDGFKRFEVVYSSGYTTLTFPEDIKLAVINEVMSEFLLSRSEPRPTENISGFDKSIQLSGKTKEIMNYYKR